MKEKKKEKYNLHVRITPQMADKLRRIALLSDIPLTVFVRQVLAEKISLMKGKS